MSKNKIHLLAGTYTPAEGNGIHIYSFDQETGEWEAVGRAEADYPTYLIPSKNERCVYSVSEKPESPSLVEAFLFHRVKQEMNLIDSVVSGDEGSCYITLDKDEKHIITANYGGGSISVFDIDSDGQFYKMSQLIVFEGRSIHPKRQTRPHIHCVEFSPDGKYLFATDLGTDRIHQMEIDYDCHVCGTEFVVHKTSKSVKVPDCSGPRHLVFHPSGKYVYVSNELSDTVIAFAYNDGELSQIQEIPIVTNDACGTADIVVTPDGKYLYTSVRLKEDGIAIFKIDSSTGMLQKIGYEFTGIHPRNLRITPNGKYLLASCRDSSRIEIYKISEDGQLENLNKDIPIPKPACLKFM